MNGFCLECKNFYDDDHKAFNRCPNDHPLLHETKCHFCGMKLYCQVSDDYCQAEDSTGIICNRCIEKLMDTNL